MVCLYEQRTGIAASFRAAFHQPKVKVKAKKLMERSTRDFMENLDAHRAMLSLHCILIASRCVPGKACHVLEPTNIYVVNAACCPIAWRRLRSCLQWISATGAWCPLYAGAITALG